MEGPALGTTINVATAVCEYIPAVPVTVILYVP